MWKTVLSLIWNNVRVLVLGHNRCHDTPSSGQEVRSSPGPRWAPENRAPGDLSVNPSVDVNWSGQGKGRAKNKHITYAKRELDQDASRRRSIK